MAALLCCASAPLARAARQEILEQCAALRAAGVNVLWLSAAGGDPAGPGFALSRSTADLARAWDSERTAAAELPGTIPSWVAEAIAAEEFDRVLVLAAGEQFGPAEAELARALVAAGAEAVELVPRAGLGELSQSWISGRRTIRWPRP